MSDRDIMYSEMSTTPRPMIAYAFVLPQTLGETYTPEKGLVRGTIFPELDIPYGKYGNQHDDQGGL